MIVDKFLGVLADALFWVLIFWSLGYTGVWVFKKIIMFLTEETESTKKKEEE